MKILIADDHPTNLKLLRAQLEAEGHEVIEAVDGVDALDLLNRQRVDAVISDILMPRMDGYRLCYEVRHSKPFRDLPFVVYTSTYTSPGDEQLAGDVGADKYIKKPASAGEIVAALREVTVRPRKVSSPPVGPETEVLKEYSERLIAKLEEKLIQLAQREEQLRKGNAELEQRVAERTAELQAANKELESFSYSVSHNLRAPLRAMDGFSRILMSEFAEKLPPQAVRHLQHVRDSAQEMDRLVQDLLSFARFNREPLHKQPVDPSKLVRRVLDDLRDEWKGRRVEFVLGDLPSCQADPALLKEVWMNLAANAIKYTRKREAAVIEIGAREQDGEQVYFVKDNGAGFDMQYAGKLFGVFQRLHAAEEYEGTGVGLAIVQRIIHRHGGRIWAEAALKNGATFFFTLGGKDSR